MSLVYLVNSRPVWAIQSVCLKRDKRKCYLQLYMQLYMCVHTDAYLPIQQEKNKNKSFSKRNGWIEYEPMCGGNSSNHDVNSSCPMIDSGFCSTKTLQVEYLLHLRCQTSASPLHFPSTELQLSAHHGCCGPSWKGLDCTHAQGPDLDLKLALY